MENNGALCPAWQDMDTDVCKGCFKREECEASRKPTQEEITEKIQGDIDNPYSREE